MKKIVTLLLSLTLVFALAGCGKEQSATYSLTTDLEGMTMTDTHTIKAKGDKVYELSETTLFDFSNTDADVKALLVETYDATYSDMKEKAPENVSIDYSCEGNLYTIDCKINLEGADLQELMDGGYIVSTTNETNALTYISYKQTITSLESAGYVLQE